MIIRSCKVKSERCVCCCWVGQQQTGSPKSWRSLDLEHGAAASSGIAGARPAFKTQRSSSMPTPKSSGGGGGGSGGSGGTAGSKTDMGSAVCHGYAAAVATGLDHSLPGPVVDVKERSTRGSVSNENNILLDPEVLTDYPTQALLLTVLVRIILAGTMFYAHQHKPWATVALVNCLTSVCLTSVAYISPESRTERPRKTKIGTEVAHVTRDSDTAFKVKRSKVKVTRWSRSTQLLYTEPG